MKNIIWVIIGVLVLSVLILGFAQRNKKVVPTGHGCDQADENKRFECHKRVFNDKEHTVLRAEELAAKESAEVKHESEVMQDKGEGQFKFKF